MTTSHKRTTAGAPLAVESRDGAKTRYLTPRGDGPTVMVIPGGDASES
jgi:hypothetical protein